MAAKGKTNRPAEVEISIHVACPSCGKKFQAGVQHVGKRGKCPNCGALIRIAESQSSPRNVAADQANRSPTGPDSAPVGTPRGAASTPEAGEADAADQWRLRTPDGASFGPVSKRELDAWVAEGRVDAAAGVYWEGWGEWRLAREVFPSLEDPDANSTDSIPVGIAIPTPSPTEHSPVAPALPSTVTGKHTSSPRLLTVACIVIFAWEGLWGIYNLMEWSSFNQAKLDLGSEAMSLAPGDVRLNLARLYTYINVNNVGDVVFSGGMICCAFLLLTRKKKKARTAIFWLKGVEFVWALLFCLLLERIVSNLSHQMSFPAREWEKWALLFFVEGMYFLLIIYCLTRPKVSKALT